VDVSVTDNDIPGVTVSTTDVAVSESGTTATYTVVLDTIPAADVTVAITATPASQASIDLPALTFTAASWNTPQTITVSATDDFVAEGPHSAVLSHVATSADTHYAGIAIADVAAAISDDDSVGVEVTPT